MKLYVTPSGTWSGSEAAWKADMKKEGHDAKAATRKIVDVPVDKAGLMEFLTFHSVNPIEPGGTTHAPAAVAASNPQAPLAATVIPSPSIELDNAFDAAPIGQQLRLAVSACDRAAALLRNKSPAT